MTSPRWRSDSRTETYVALRLSVDNWRWAGVPFYLRTGKAMHSRRTEIVIQFKHVPCALFRDGPRPATLAPNLMVLHVQPDEGVSLRFQAKVPGPAVRLAGVDMDFHYADYFNAALGTGYETLLYDCLIGDPTLFQRADNIEAGWRAVQPFLDAGARCPTMSTATLPAAGGRSRPTSCWRLHSPLAERAVTGSGEAGRHGRPSLLLSDVDGTMVTDDKVLTEASRRAVGLLQDGRHPVRHHQQPATGRPRHRGGSTGHRHADRGLQRRDDRGAG